MIAKISNLKWLSDYYGYEVGYPDTTGVGFYSSDELSCSLYMSYDTHEVLEVFNDGDDE